MLMLHLSLDALSDGSFDTQEPFCEVDMAAVWPTEATHKGSEAIIVSFSCCVWSVALLNWIAN